MSNLYLQIFLMKFMENLKFIKEKNNLQKNLILKVILFVFKLNLELCDNSNISNSNMSFI